MTVMESTPPPHDVTAPETGTAASTIPSKDERTMAMLCHLLAFSGFIVPFGNLLGPLVLWLIKKETMPFVDQQGKEVLNFQITMMIAFVVCFITAFLILPILIGLCIGIAGFVFMIIGAIKANDGIDFRYPWILRLIK